MKGLNVLIIDDEPPARNVIKHFLNEYSFINSIREAKNGLQALNIIDEEMPDLIFLDIQLPEMSGFDFLGELITRYNPFIVFTTAYDKYTIKAFEYNAFDYLLKPFDSDRFKVTMQRLLSTQQKNEGIYQQNLLRLIEYYEKHNNDSNRFISKVVVKVKKKYTFVKINDILCFEGSGNYIKIYCANGSTQLIYKTLNKLETILNLSELISLI